MLRPYYGPREEQQIMTTAKLMVLARRGVLTRVEAREALERLRPMIRLAAYLDARQYLESDGETYEEK